MKERVVKKATAYVVHREADYLNNLVDRYDTETNPLKKEKTRLEIQSETERLFAKDCDEEEEIIRGLKKMSDRIIDDEQKEWKKTLEEWFDNRSPLDQLLNRNERALNEKVEEMLRETKEKDSEEKFTTRYIHLVPFPLQFL